MFLSRLRMDVGEFIQIYLFETFGTDSVVIWILDINTNSFCANLH